ncbi:diguanylate cyclase [Scandinavium sp. TWS1a]|uniref:GGDEF domain-containing protein n=1 Tax=Scandinavium tedordense TaxID=2926521 RepID=UPI002166B2A2|nr:diguanylate cyclase [Scandinavium tedordense]MCS2169193.1 diguanylate cyclase [Scandinavium tedordense]
MKKERLHTAINDAELCLHRLAKLMPGLSAHRTLTDVLQLIHGVFDARLSWIMLESEDVQHIEVLGDPLYAEESARHLLAALHLQQAPWRVKCWHRDVGRLLYPDAHPLAQELQCGVLCRIFPLQDDVRAFLFLAFDQPLLAPGVLRSVALIIAEKLHDAMTELITRERTAVELKNIVNQYRILFDRAPVLMNSFDKHNRCILWNGECERVFGWTLDEINRQPDPLALFYPDPEVRRGVRESVNYSPTLEMHEWYPRRRDGEVLATLWSNIMLPDGEIMNIGVDITERKRAENLLAFQATTDALTCCYNRLAILDHLQQSLDNCHSEQNDTHFVMVMIDLDYFKQINDRWGHVAGDDALVYFCQRVREQCEGQTRLGRLGGEEFLLLLPFAETGEAVAFTERLRAQLCSVPFAVGDVSVVMSFSAGVMGVRENNTERAVLLTLVDNALYDAKRTGRGKTVVTSLIS